MKFYAIVKRWDSNKARQVVFTAGEFNNMVNALICADALGDYYHCKVEIQVDDIEEEVSQ